MCSRMQAVLSNFPHRYNRRQFGGICRRIIHQIFVRGNRTGTPASRGLTGADGVCLHCAPGVRCPCVASLRPPLLTGSKGWGGGGRGGIPQALPPRGDGTKSGKGAMRLSLADGPGRGRALRTRQSAGARARREHTQTERNIVGPKQSCHHVTGAAAEGRIPMHVYKGTGSAQVRGSNGQPQLLFFDDGWLTRYGGVSLGPPPQGPHPVFHAVFPLDPLNPLIHPLARCCCAKVCT